MNCPLCSSRRLAVPFRPLAFASVAVALTFGAFGQVSSRPVGYVVHTIPAGQTRSFSIPFDADVTSQSGAIGRVTAVGVDYLENSAASWTPGAFSNANAPYFVRLTGGAHAGRTFRVITPANTATRLYVADDGVGLAALELATGANGTPFEIVPGDTLATFFGTTASGDSLVLQGGANALEGDMVQVWGGASWLNFYYNTAWNRWARDTDLQSDLSRNNFLLRSDRGLMITRRGSTPLQLAVLGRVLATPQRAFHARAENSLTFLATMQPGDVTLAELALQNSTHSTGWRSSSDAAAADLLFVWSGATWFSFFFNSTVGHWQLAGDPTASYDTFVIRAGTPVFVQRRASGASVEDKTINFPQPGT